jgi:EAL domain-containing protein (putative c-di-GMP-specific phosphodiesterase class I)/CHASE2 domain-containing sensor protein
VRRLRLQALLARRRILVTLAASALGALILVTGWGEGVDERLATVRNAIYAHPASGEIHIVEIDEKSIAAIDRWPWPRAVHAAAVEKLRSAGARVVGFDVDFSNPSAPADDARFAEALAKSGGTVILPTLRQQAESGSAESIDTGPIPAFAAHSFLAVASVRPDSDGTLRRMPYGLETLGAAHPSLAAMLAEATGETGRFFAIDLSTDPDTIPRHSMIDLLSGRIAPGALAGKRVVIGATAVELGDRYAVPGRGVLPGVVIQALAAETLLHGAPPEPASGAWPLLLALGAVFLAVRPRSRPRRLAILAGVAAILIALALAAPILFPAAPALAALAAAFILGGASAIAESYERRAGIDSDTGLPNFTALEKACNGAGEVRIAVARIHDFVGIASALGPGGTKAQTLSLARGLAFGTGGAAIYRTDDGGLAWVAERTADWDALAAIARSGSDGRVELSLHFGLASGPGAEARQVAADAALAALRAERRGLRWVAFEDADAQAAKWHVALPAELDTAIAAGRIWNAYQAKYDLRSGALVGAEALVRWDHKERGPLGPDTFIPPIEEQGRAADLTCHVLTRALADCAAWDEAGAPLTVSVNISATLLHDAAFDVRLRQILAASGVPAERLIIEVTESAALADPDAAIATLLRWRELSLGISIDDYGTGQSSLSYLQRLPATELKIDKSFVSGLRDDARSRIMVRSTIALAHELGLKVVAEGVEDEGALDLVRAMGCDTVQGFHLGRPVSAEAFASLVADSRPQSDRSLSA